MCTLQEIELLKTLNKQGNLFLNIQNRYNALVRPELSLIEETSSPRLGSLVETLVNMGNSQDLGGGGNTNTPTGTNGGGDGTIGGCAGTQYGCCPGTSTPSNATSTNCVGGHGSTLGGGGCPQMSGADTVAEQKRACANAGCTFKDKPLGNKCVKTSTQGGCAGTQYGCCPGTSTPSNATKSNCIGGGGSQPPPVGGNGGGNGGGDRIADPKLRALNAKFNS